VGGEVVGAHSGETSTVLGDGGSDRVDDVSSFSKSHSRRLPHSLGASTPDAQRARSLLGSVSRGGTIGFWPDNFNVRAFIWTKRDGMRSLGTLPGDATSQALGINERRQVVGVSCGTSCRADINDRGQISGQTVNANNERSAFVAYPTR